MKTLSILTLCLMLAGCQSVPSTRIVIPTTRGTAELVSPKETSWEDVDVMFAADGTFRLKIGKAKAANQADVVKIVTDANKEMFEKGLQLGEQLSGKLP